MASMPGWIAVACKDHAMRGIAGGFVQVNHGKLAPLRRMAPGELVAVYAPSRAMGKADGLQSFVALGRLRPGAPYQGDMGGGFLPYRRDVDWFEAQDAPIRPLLGHLALTAGKVHWGAPFRFGLLRVEDADMVLIAAAMGCQLPVPG
jgi:hypothetical protein